jgi:hypothetical protein
MQDADQFAEAATLEHIVAGHCLLRKKTEEGKTEDWKRRTSNIEHPTPSVEQKRRKKQTGCPGFLSSVRHWMFSVRCSMFAFPKKRHAQSKGSVLVLQRSGLLSWMQNALHRRVAKTSSLSSRIQNSKFKIPLPSGGQVGQPPRKAA